MNNRDFFDKNFIEFSYNKEGGPYSSYTAVKDKAEAEKILSFDIIFNTLNGYFSGNIKLTNFLTSGNCGDHFGFEVGNGIRIYLDFKQNVVSILLKCLRIIKFLFFIHYSVDFF